MANLIGGVSANTLMLCGHYPRIATIQCLQYQRYFQRRFCPLCDQFINTAGKLEQNLTTCKERVKHVFTKNVYQLRETLFDKLDSLNIPYSDDQKLLKNTAIFDFESICVQEDNYNLDRQARSNVCINFVQLD